jgi:hypothetical protein
VANAHHAARSVLLLALLSSAARAESDVPEREQQLEPERAVPSGPPAFVSNAVAFAVLGPAVLVDGTLLAASRSPLFGVFAGIDAVSVGVDLAFLFTNLARRDEAPVAPRRLGPKGFSIWHAVSSTRRFYCARPGVSSCAEFDALPVVPMGDEINFNPQTDYLGRYLRAELFPLGWTHVDGPLQGFGIVGGWGVGFSVTNVTVESPAGSSAPQQVTMTDKQWDLQAAYRYSFSFNAADPHAGVGYVGIRGGVAGRVFEVDPTSSVPLPSSNRIYPIVGVDVFVPAYLKYVGIELSASYLVDPKPGPLEIAAFGDPRDASGGATGSGFEAEAGLGGTIWGPLGYRLAVRFTSYADHYFGAGQRWMFTTQGAAEERYASWMMGLTSSF